MNTLPPQYTLGQLISDLESSEKAYQDNLRTAGRIEARDGHNLVSKWWQIQAGAFLFQPDAARHPGIDRIEALCDEWGTGLKAENVRKLRGRVCSKLGVGVTAVNAMSLDEVAAVLGLAIPGQTIDEKEAAVPPQSLQAVVIIEADRRFMELAIAEARKSMSEDNRAHPMVGAVVVKDGAIVAAAFRGELGHGEHAEYTALERKLPDEALVDATVYATLEPCTTRNHPKVPCAQRLVERKVRRVVFGMLDPNPQICGKGERFLRDHGIEVERFPHELVMQLEELNRDFVRAHKQPGMALLAPRQLVADPAAGLRALQVRFVEAQDRFPREVAFALVMIPHNERQAWKTAFKWFQDAPTGSPQKLGWKCLAYAEGADTPESISIPASERNDGMNCPLLYPLDSWRCWLLRQSTTAPYPTAALNLFHSLAADGCRLLDLHDCGELLEGRHIPGRPGKYQHLLRWCVEQLPRDQCEKLTWLDPPNEHLRTPPEPDRTPRRWLVEMPCVFAAVAQAIERHIAGVGKPWPLV